MHLKEIIEATLIELDRGTAADTVSMYADKFTAYANEAVNEIVRRFKMTRTDEIHLLSSDSPRSAGCCTFSVNALSHGCKRIVHVYKGTIAPTNLPVITEHDYKNPLHFYENFFGNPERIAVEGTKSGDIVFVEYRYIPTPMLAPSISNLVGGDEPEIPEYMHPLIPLYVRSREQCGQDPSTQGTSSAYFSLFNQAVYNLQRETLATPESFNLQNYHFE